MVEPRSRLGRGAKLDKRRAVEVEAAHVLALDPSAHRDQPVRNLQRQAGCPGQPFDRPVLVEPSACRFGDDLAVTVAFERAVLVEDRHPGQARIDARTRPAIATRDENVGPAPVHDRIEIIEIYTLRRAFIIGGGRVDDRRGEFGLFGHGVHSNRTRSLKSAPASSGMSRTTVRLARVQRSVQVKAAVMPTSPWSTRMISRSTPGITGR